MICFHMSSDFLISFIHNFSRSLISTIRGGSGHPLAPVAANLKNVAELHIRDTWRVVFVIFNV